MKKERETSIVCFVRAIYDSSDVVVDDHRRGGLLSSSLGGAVQGEGREVTSFDKLLLKASSLSSSSLGCAAQGAGIEATALRFGWVAWHMRQGPGSLPSFLKVHSPQIQTDGAMAN